MQNDDVKVSDDWRNWFAGFTAGEGCFTIGKRNKISPCANYQCRFVIKLRDDDRAILEEIRDTLGIGKIYDTPTNTYNSHNNQPQTEFHVAVIKDCAKLVEIFNRYPLRAKKQNDFLIWKQAVAELQKPYDERNPDLLEYYFLKIKAVRKYDGQEELIKPITINLQLTIDFP